MLVLVPPYRQNCNALWDILLGQCISDVHQALRCIVGYIDCPFYSGQLLLNIPHQYKLVCPLCSALCRVQGVVWDPAIVLCVNTNCVSASEIILTPDLNTYAELQLQHILSRYKNYRNPTLLGLEVSVKMTMLYTKLFTNLGGKIFGPRIQSQSTNCRLSIHHLVDNIVY